MYAALLCYTRRVPKANSQRGVWMKDLGISISRARAQRKVSQWGAAIVAALATLFGMAITASAQAPTPKRTVIRAGRVLNVRNGELRSNQTIVIEGDRISQIAPSSEVKAAAGDTTIDLPDATLLPGLIDMHTHLTFELSSLSYEGLKISTAREALHGARNARRTLEAGFTTVRNLGAKDYADIALRDAINDGDVIGPRIVASGPALGITGGHCDENLLPPAFHFQGEGVADGIEGVQHKVREVIKYGADVIKICATGGVLSKGDDPNASQYTLEEMKAIVADAHRLGRKVAAHAHGAEGVRWASEAGVDSIEHGHLMDDAAIATLKKNGTYLVPTLFLGEYMEKNMDRSDVPEYSKQKMRDVIAAMRKNTGKAFAAGVKVAFGTDAAVYPHGLNAGEFHVYVQLGMTPLAAIQTATINASDLLGPKFLVGSLEPGKFGDVIAVDGDPSKDVTILEHVRFVMKGGTVYKNDYSKK
jgi:imidazolonepropionase-like amidohydrolase